MTKQTPIKLSVLLLDYNKSVRILDNVAYLLDQKTNFNCEIIVTDNSPNAVNRPKLEVLRNKPGIVLHFNQVNLGYTKAYNQAVKNYAQGQYILLQNPDILMKETDSLQKMVDFMDKHPDIAIMGPKQINDDGQRAMSVRAFPKLTLQVARRTVLRKLPIVKKWVEYDEMTHLDYSKIQEVDWLQSSCVIIRKDFWEKVGGLCEDYFLFMSDPEICWQAWKMGYKVIYNPSICVQANGQRVSGHGGLETFVKNPILRQHLKDSLKYRWKFFFQPNPRLQRTKKQEK